MIQIDETTLIHAPIERCFDLSRSVEVHLLANVHSGERAMARGGVTSDLVGLSQEVTWRAKHFGVWQTLTSKTTAMEPPRYFQVTMVRGIFHFMQADHPSSKLGLCPAQGAVAAVPERDGVESSPSEARCSRTS
jgi:hypothetical protein